MRKMRYLGRPGEMTTTINVVEHVILKNLWEYYITDEPCDNPDVVFALVMGDETELGDVYMPEIKPYIITRTKNLNDVFPASGWQWVEE